MLIGKKQQPLNCYYDSRSTLSEWIGEILLSMLSRLQRYQTLLPLLKIFKKKLGQKKATLSVTAISLAVIHYHPVWTSREEYLPV